MSYPNEPEAKCLCNLTGNLTIAFEQRHLQLGDPGYVDQAAQPYLPHQNQPQRSSSSTAYNSPRTRYFKPGDPGYVDLSAEPNMPHRGQEQNVSFNTAYYSSPPRYFQPGDPGYVEPPAQSAQSSSTAHPGEFPPSISRWLGEGHTAGDGSAFGTGRSHQTAHKPQPKAYSSRGINCPQHGTRQSDNAGKEGSRHSRYPQQSYRPFVEDVDENGESVLG